MAAGHQVTTRFARSLAGAASLFAVLTAIPCSARADAGVPMLVLIWPASWILFIPVVALEAWIARKIVGLTVKRSVLASACANAVSTLVGIPLVWALLVVIELTFSKGGQGFGIDTFWRRAYAVTVQAPWLIPYESELHWMIPLAAVVLLVPFFFASVFIERVVFRRVCSSSPELARRWSWMANVASYSFILAGLVVVLIVALVHGPHGR
jgi:hypothetical protein